MLLSSAYLLIDLRDSHLSQYKPIYAGSRYSFRYRSASILSGAGWHPPFNVGGSGAYLASPRFFSQKGLTICPRTRHCEVACGVSIPIRQTRSLSLRHRRGEQGMSLSELAFAVRLIPRLDRFDRIREQGDIDYRGQFAAEHGGLVNRDPGAH